MCSLRFLSWLYGVDYSCRISLEGKFLSKASSPSEFLECASWMAVFTRWVGLVVLLTWSVWMKLSDLVSLSLDGMWLFKAYCQKWHLLLAQGRCAGPDQCQIPSLTCSCFPFMHGQVQPVELPWQWLTCSLGGECKAGIAHTSGIATAVFLQMICQTAWEFFPSKWWANSGSLTFYCPLCEEGRDLFSPGTRQELGCQRIFPSMLLLVVEMLCKPSYSVLRNR